MRHASIHSVLVRSLCVLVLAWFAGTVSAQSDLPTAPIESAAIDLVVVMKADRMLYLYADGTMVDQYPIALGKNPVGPKRAQGDRKTPEGLYRLDWRNPDSDFYRSMHVSYPNASDRRASQRLGVDDPGDLIMIHGQPSYDDREREGDWTDGCIAVSNAAMDEIWRRVRDDTRIHIYP